MRMLPAALFVFALGVLAPPRQAPVYEVASHPRLIVPGHDPSVFERFPAVAPGVVQIR